MKKVKAFFVQYEVAGVGLVWWRESLSSSQAFELGRELAKKGLRPVVICREFSPSEIVSKVVFRQRIAA
jgi:hypothetical protein